MAVIVDGAVPEDCDGAGVLQCGYPLQPDQHDDNLINDNLNSMKFNDDDDCDDSCDGFVLKTFLL